MNALKLQRVGTRRVPGLRILRGLLLAVITGLWMGPAAHAQTVAPTGVIRVAVGNSHLLIHPVALRRVSIADPGVADAVVVSATEIVINGKLSGTTSLLLWDNAGGREFYTVRVTPDAASLQEDLDRLFPEESISVKATNGTIILTGDIQDARTAHKAMDIAAGTLGEEVTIIDNLSVPDPGQILLQVRFAEVRRSAMEDLGINAIHMDPFNPRGTTEGAVGAGKPGTFSGDFSDLISPDQSFSDAVNLFLFSPDANVGVFIQALKERGMFRSLAEPNLLAVDGEEASFLAGGEFPFPVIQGSNSGNSVTIQFKEFGIQLRFTPHITNSGNIRLHVAPEVSVLDFGNGLIQSGFTIPALLTRRAETEIELQDGQTFAIAGLIDNGMAQTISKIPVLGDIPILGALFRSKQMIQNRTELLVLVTPRLVRPLDEAPELPTGEADEWDWDQSMEGPAAGLKEDMTQD